MTVLTDKQIQNNQGIITSLLRSTGRANIEGLIDFMTNQGFFIGPSSKHYHQSYKGGNAQHSLQVFYNLLAENDLLLSPLDVDSIIIIGLLHDLCKIDAYVFTEYITNDQGDIIGQIIESNPNLKDRRHAEKSIDMITKFIVLTDQELLAIRYHMGIYCQDYSWDEFGKAIRSYPIVYSTHVADMKDTYNMGVRR